MTKAHINDRAAGVLVGLACGDALGAGYEFGPPIPLTEPVDMIGGGTFDWEVGEWTDDTSMAIAIAHELFEGANLLEPATLGRIIESWQGWALEASDVGIQTRAVLSALAEPTESAAREASQKHHESRGRSGGNGSLMRTAPIALAYLHDATGLTEAARRVAQLTHWEDDAWEACVLWCHAIRHTILTGELDIRIGLSELSTEHAELWLKRIDEAERSVPSDFTSNNGWVVAAFQGAWSAIVQAKQEDEDFETTVEYAVRGGGDTDTVAAIAGSLAGAYFGVSGIPAKWRRVIKGWPDLYFRDLLNMGVVIASGKSKHNVHGWPLIAKMPAEGPNAMVRHPHDPGVWMATIGALDQLNQLYEGEETEEYALSDGVIDAVVSMSRVGTNQLDLPEIQYPDMHAPEFIEFWLIDEPGRNIDTAFVLKDAADTVAALRAQHKQVVIHCVAAHNRTPAAAVAYSILHCGVPFEQAWEDVRAALPDPRFNEEFYQALKGL